MFWDASQVYNNGRLDATIKSALLGGASAPSTSSSSTTTTTKTTTSSPTTTKPTTTTTKTTTTSTSTVGTGSCASVAAWSATATYTGGLQAVYNGHLWTAQWWTYGDVPGGSAGVWKDNGACSGFAAAAHTGPMAANTTPGSQATKDMKAQPQATAEPASQTGALRHSRFFREQAM
jgi:chitinase